MILALILAPSLLACRKSVDACELVGEHWDSELASVQACTVDEDCGQPLPGTSCGAQNCTRNLVGRYDADIGELEYILQLGQDLSCDLVPDTDCDCPDAVGFFCDDGTCAWSYAGAGG